MTVKVHLIARLESERGVEMMSAERRPSDTASLASCGPTGS